MSIDVVSIIDTITGLGFPAILLLATFRGVQIGRTLVSRVYRNRAIWIAGVCLAQAVQSQVPDSWMIGGLPVFELAYFVLITLIFVFIDSTIMVTLELDFFHRNTLRWRRGRFVAYPALIGTLVAGATATALGYSLDSPLLLLFPVTFGYAVGALIIGSRRTPDRTLRRHIILLGFVVIIFVTTTFMFNFTSIVSVDLLDDFLTLLTAYLLYRAVMTLSPLGRVEKELALTSMQGETAVTPSPS
jgi:hypothetical protein